MELFGVVEELAVRFVRDQGDETGSSFNPFLGLVVETQSWRVDLTNESSDEDALAI